MRILDLTLPTPEENLACDEALLDACEEEGREVLRFWEPAAHFVVLGYANALRSEVRSGACRAAGVPVLRRMSGGGTVLQGPGVLNYSLVLRAEEPAMRTIPATNRAVMGRNRACLERLLPGPVTAEGDTDLALSGRKFSGNAQRRRRKALLFHGTFLLGLDFALLDRVLPLPAKQPAYRRSRAHGDFLVNLGLAPARIKKALAEAWSAKERLSDLPVERIRRLARTRYADPAWTAKF
ncbi:MAG: lipoate--protein ligase family protein [Candidatus Omnitrophica bacterium]|nr:lipoate--protein ligase family protein [Candidatus Omnitrophota bacterium]